MCSSGDVLRLLSFSFAGILLTLAASTSAQGVVDERRARLQSELSRIERDIAEQQIFLEAKQRERVSLERDVAILDAQIDRAKLSIKARNLVIQGLTRDIQQKEGTIIGFDEKIVREKESLGAILRQANEISDTSLVLIALGNDTISDFFADLEAFESVQKRLFESFHAIEQSKQVTRVEKEDLEEKRGQEVGLRQVQELEKRKIETQEAEKQRILKATKGDEAAYQALIATKQKSAAQIRAELFALRGTAAIPFGKALEYADAAARETGIRPAFLLAIIAEESNLGENVGTGSWRVDMHPKRDQPVFKALTDHLGLNPDTMPVSKKPWYGYGGAMGPAQFIPSTWVCFAGYVNMTTGKCGPNSDGSWSGPWEYQKSKDRIGRRTGDYPPNPWDPKDALMASALYLTDSGADAQTRAAEFRAAMCYLAGCGNVNNKSLQFYGNEVMELAVKYQGMIDVLR